ALEPVNRAVVQPTRLEPHLQRREPGVARGKRGRREHQGRDRKRKPDELEAADPHSAPFVGRKWYCLEPRLKRPKQRLQLAKRSGPQFLPQALVDDLRVRLAPGLLHHLADEEAEQALLAATVRLDLGLVLAEDPVDHRVELTGVADRAVRE